MATHSSILAWIIPWTEEPGGLQSMGSQRVRHDWVTKKKKKAVKKLQMEKESCPTPICRKAEHKFLLVKIASSPHPQHQQNSPYYWRHNVSTQMGLPRQTLLKYPLFFIGFPHTLTFPKFPVLEAQISFLLSLVQNSSFFVKEYKLRCLF